MSTLAGMLEHSDGVAIIHDSRTVALKWHRLRRRRSDPLFGAEALGLGLQLGASMEIDLRVTADGSFVVLHDATLDRETDGTGEIAGLTRVQLNGVRYRDRHQSEDGEAQRAVLFVDDIAELVLAAHPHALLQFDMKDNFAVVGEKGLEYLEGLFADRQPPIVISGECLDLMERIRDRLPNIGRGIDPTERLVPLLRLRDMEEVVGQLRDEITGPTEPEIIYLAWPLLIAARQEGLDLVEICHGEGKKVDAWTFNLSKPAEGFSNREWADFLQLLELGVDQITTDEAIATQRAYRARTASE